MDDIELIKKVKKGDVKFFSKLVKLYEKDLYRVAISMMGNDNDALDCIQDAILASYENIKNLSTEKFFKTWMIKILINKCNDSLKRKKRIIPYAEIPADTDHQDNIDSADIDIKYALDHLENELKIIVILYYYEDMNIRAISESVNIPEGTVKSRLSRARAKLKDLLAYDDEEVI